MAASAVAFVCVNLPPLAFVAAFSIACPAVLPVRVYQVLFTGYWFWGNFLSPKVLPTISGTVLVASGLPQASAFFDARFGSAGYDAVRGAEPADADGVRRRRLEPVVQYLRWQDARALMTARPRRADRVHASLPPADRPRRATRAAGRALGAVRADARPVRARAGRRLDVTVAFLGMILPLNAGMLAASAIVDDPALELQFAAPRPAWRLLLERMGLVLAIAGVAAVSFQLLSAAVGVSLAGLGGVARRQLSWLVPCAALCGLSTAGALGTRHATGGALLVGLVWIIQVIVRERISATGWDGTSTSSWALVSRHDPISSPIRSGSSLSRRRSPWRA